MKVNLQFYYIPVCRAKTPISPVKVSQLPLVTEPLEITRQMASVVTEDQYIKIPITMLSLCVCFN